MALLMSKKSNIRREEYIRRLSENNLVRENANNLLFNFKFFRSGEKYGEKFEEWEQEAILADLNNKLKNFSGKTKEDLLMNGTLEIYKHYPLGSRFEQPKALKSLSINWARLRITGRRRLIGFFMQEYMSEKFRNIFYIVFLDKEHKFAPNN